MKKLLCLSLASLLLHSIFPASARDTATVFQVGNPDGDYGEFAIAGNYAAFAKQFPHDVDFTVGQSNPKEQWPFIHPGPQDMWAGGRAHAFKLTFTLPQLESGYYRLVVDFVSAQGAAPPRLTVDINGTQLRRQLPPGPGDEPLTHAKAGKHCALEQVIPSSLLHTGANTITLINAEGSWALYDAIRLESGVPAPTKLVQVTTQPLPWFKRTPEGGRRVIKVAVENLASATLPGQVNWTAAGQSGTQKFDAHFGNNEVFVTLPDIEQKTAVELTVRAGDNEVKASATLQPARKWKVFIVPTVHTDIGYTDLQERVMARHADNITQALAMLDKHPSFNWDCETFWQLDCFLRAHPEKQDAIFARLREGRMGLSTLFGNMLTGLCSHEALNRVTLNARDLANQGGFSFESAILDDVPSAVGSLPMVLANSGIKYFIEGCNNDRGPYATQGLKNPFYWEGPDGSRVLAHIGAGYGMAGGLLSSMERATERLPGFLASHENADYPYDAVLINGAFGDNQGVSAWLPEVVEKWNAQWEYPKLILGRPADFLGYIEKHYAAKVPVLKADFGGWWEDGAASSALETTLNRRAEERAVTAEMLHSLTTVVAGGKYPKADFDELWRNILLYDEHTWGAWCSISQPEAEQTVKQWEVKGSFARKADEQSRQLLHEGLAKLAAITPTADLVVFNPLSWSRKEVVLTEAEAVQALGSKTVLPCQLLPEGGSCFIASDLPSVGYRSYRQMISAPPAKNTAVFEGPHMENEFYRVLLDPTTGALKSVFDKEAGCELVDPESEYGLGEVVYVSGGEGSYAVHSDLHLPAPKFSYHRTTVTQLESLNGPVFAELTCKAKAEKLPALTLRVRLYHGLKRLDLRYEWLKEETTAKEAVYIAFPFAFDLQKGGLWLEYPDAITEPLKDQHSSACRDWYAVQRWLAASDGAATVVLSPLDTPLVTLGGMTASTWPRQLSLKRAHVFAYAMNNYWHTNYKAEQGGPQVFRFSLTSNRGAFSKRDAVARGWEMYCPAVAQRGQGEHPALLTAPAKALVGVHPAGLPLMALKQAEDQSDYIFRLCDFAGAGGTAKLTLPREATSLAACDLVEAHARELKCGGKTLAAPVKPYGPLTLKVKFAARAQ
jgi:alpha-mannosidase